MGGNAKPAWESYESDDPKVIAEKEKTEKLKRQRMKPPPAPTPAPTPTATEAWAGAEKKAKVNQAIEKGTRHLRRAIPGQGQ